MAHSIELTLDARSDAAIRQLWQALDDAGLPSQTRVTSATNRPHITLLAAERISADVDPALTALEHRIPLPVLVGAPLVFGGGRLVLARLIVASAALLELHREIYDRCLPHLTGEPYAHTAPGHWTPHVTLGRRLTAEQLGDAFAAVDGVSADITASAVGLRRWDGDARFEQVLI